MEKAKITALLDALCDRPLKDGRLEPANLRAFCREAARTLSQSAATGAAPDSAADTDRLTAALALLLSGTESDEACRTVEDAVLRSEAARLDAQSAIAFVDALEQSREAAPADLVDELLAADQPVSAGASMRQGVERTGVWSRLGGKSWSARRWGLAAGCITFIFAGAASWTIFLQRTSPESNGPPVADAARQQQPTVDASASATPGLAAPPPLALTTERSCEPRTRAGGPTSAAQTAARADQPTLADPACEPGNQSADRPADALEQTMARQRAEAARNGEAAAAQADREGHRDGLLGDPSRPLFDSHPPAAAARAASPAIPTVRPAAPAGIQ